MDEQVGPASRALIVTGLKTIHCPDMPLADPVRGPGDRQIYSVRDPRAEIHVGPIQRVEKPDVALAVVVEIANIVPVVPSHLPTGSISVVAPHHRELAAGA